ncbi:MAG: 4Fe-4S binding protein [Dehalococcoidia bacterium]
MKEVVVLSGKGGTGKTSIVGGLACLVDNKVLCDCDVDAADLFLLLDPVRKQDNEFWSGQTARIEPEKCTQCGLCEDMCRFDAISDYAVNPSFCEGCGFCSHICPEEAIIMEDNLSGHWYFSDTRYGPLVHARLGIAEENSGKLVSTVRKEAWRVGEEMGLDYVITDGPPGIGCPVISSLSGASAALVVTEPTLSGMHDLERVIGVCKHFGVPAMVCINKYDLSEENTTSIESTCQELGLEVVARIPYDDVITEALIKGVPVIEYTSGEVARQMESMWQSVSRIIAS